MSKKPKKWDFEGWATRYNIPCSDGETIAHGAFKDMDGEVVSLIDDHARGYESFLDAVIGKAYLEHRNEGIYTYLNFNEDYDLAQKRKTQVIHGDIQRLSIRANMLKRAGGKIVGGIIRDISLVSSGANPGAYIQQVQLVHSDGFVENIEDEAYICYNDEILHGADEKKEKKDPEDITEKIAKVLEIYNNMTPEEKEVSLFIGAGLFSTTQDEDKELSDDTMRKIYGKMVETHGEAVDNLVSELSEFISSGGESEITEENQSFYSTLSEEDKMAIIYMASVGDEIEQSDELDALIEEHGEEIENVFDGLVESLETGEELDEDLKAIFDELPKEDQQTLLDLANDEFDDEQIQHHYNGGEDFMKANQFNKKKTKKDESSYVAVDDFVASLRRGATLEQACIEHGVEDVTKLYDDPKMVQPEPLIVNSPQGWVKSVLNGVKKVPFTKIKSLWTDLSAFEGDHRALGYPVLGEKKKEEEITMLDRITEPGWIYKRQTLDRDVLYQITSFNFLQWLQSEMGMMLNQELARAILIGDGRLSNNVYKIKEDRVRPIAFDSSVWTIQKTIAKTATSDDVLDELIDLRSDYQGSGSPSLFVSGKQIGAWLKLKNSLGERIYKNAEEIASLLRCKEIVEVPQFSVATQSDGSKVKAVMVNLSDYALSMPTGSSALKDSYFDIDYNKESYLLEWLVGGALITPKSAIVVNQTPAT